MSNMKELRMEFDDIQKALEQIQKDLSEILEYIRDKKKTESLVLKKNRKIGRAHV